MRICVISDTHFKYKAHAHSDAANEDALLDFLKQSEGKYDLMVLNGDIFDLWYDWKYTIIKQYFPLLHRLAALQESGCRLVMISGNHDFWFNGFLEQYLKIDIHDVSCTMNVDCKKLLFTHGDLYTINDLRYKVFRRIIRMPWIKAMFSILHPDLALSIGAGMSRSSRLRRVSKALMSRKSAGLTAFAGSMINKKGYDIVVMGHSHDPVMRPIGKGHYLNCGDWLSHRSYVEIIDGEPCLKNFER